MINITQEKKDKSEIQLGKFFKDVNKNMLQKQQIKLLDPKVLHNVIYTTLSTLQPNKSEGKEHTEKQIDETIELLHVTKQPGKEVKKTEKDKIFDHLLELVKVIYAKKNNEGLLFLLMCLMENEELNGKLLLELKLHEIYVQNKTKFKELIKPLIGRSSSEIATLNIRLDSIVQAPWALWRDLTKRAAESEVLFRDFSFEAFYNKSKLNELVQQGKEITVIKGLEQVAML